MRIHDIIEASNGLYQPRFTYWLKFILAAECKLDSLGNILEENLRDGAGATFAGTTQRDDQYDPRTCTPEWVARTYHDGYWKKSDAPDLPWGVGEETANIAVNEGLGTAGKILQQTLVDMGARIGVDGAIGPATEQAAASFDSDSVLRALVAHNNEHYKAIADMRPNDQRFLRGWLNRDAEALQAFEAEAKTSQVPT
jgi:lysozyme family protein